MSTYKLIQDIEAEDHILGPLTLQQFIFALVAIFLFYLCFLFVSKLHAAFMLVLFLPPALFFGFFALPFGRDQPTEIWFLAKLRYWFKPRTRTWNQSGVKDLVTITVPKKVERMLTKSYSQNEVQSRLQALASTIDSRGWAIKHVNTYGVSFDMSGSDRLIDIASMPQEVPNDDIVPADDILDEANNPIAQQFDNMITQSTQDHRQRLVDEINDIGESAVAAQTRTPANNWFMGDGQAQASVPAGSAVTATTSAGATGEDALSARLAARNRSSRTTYNNLRTMRPSGSRPKQDPSIQNVNSTPAEAMTDKTDPAILSLAKRNDLNVSTLAREAKKAIKDNDKQDPNEVVIPLHHN